MSTYLISNELSEVWKERVDTRVGSKAVQGQTAHTLIFALSKRGKRECVSEQGRVELEVEVEVDSGEVRKGKRKRRWRRGKER